MMGDKKRFGSNNSLRNSNTFMTSSGTIEEQKVVEEKKSENI
mgnify:CR=1 FL=1